MDFFFFMYDIQHCFICRPTDSAVSEDAGIEPRTVATSALAVRRSNHSARSHPQIISPTDILYENGKILFKFSIHPQQVRYVGYPVLSNFNEAGRLVQCIHQREQFRIFILSLGTLLFLKYFCLIFHLES